MDELEKRRQRNEALLKRLKRGESLQGNPASTWFPLRPKIVKDSKLVAALYCASGHTEDGDKRKCKVCGSALEESKVSLADN